MGQLLHSVHRALHKHGVRDCEWEVPGQGVHGEVSKSAANSHNMWSLAGGWAETSKQAVRDENMAALVGNKLDPLCS